MATTASSTSSRSTTAGRSRRRCSASRATPRPRRPSDRRRQAPHLRGHGQGRETGAARRDQSACSSTSSSAAPFPPTRRSTGLKLAMPVEKSGQNEFDFQYGDDFGAHIEKFDPDFSKVLVRYNPDGDAELNQRQLERLKRLADWLHDNGRMFLFELLVPATDEQLASVGGDTDRYDAELRPELMRRAIEEIQDFGIEVDIWKIEGVDERDDAEMLADQTRVGRGPRGRRLRAARPRRQRREGRPLAARGRAGRRLRRLRDRPLDLVGRAEGLPRRLARARRCGGADRGQLPALHRRLRGGGERGRRVSGRTSDWRPSRVCAGRRRVFFF